MGCSWCGMSMTFDRGELEGRRSGIPAALREVEAGPGRSAVTDGAGGTPALRSRWAASPRLRRSAARRAPSPVRGYVGADGLRVFGLGARWRGLRLRRFDWSAP